MTAVGRGETDVEAPARLPLEDVRVLALEQFGAGPWATAQLAELGAEVIKLENPHSGGDVGRYVPPFQEGEDSLFFETFNGGKKSVQLDLQNDAGREVFVRLVERADVVFSNLRGDLPDHLGLRYRSLAAHNPRIVCCALTGYGLDGPRARLGALDYVIQGRAGWMSLTGEPGSPPTRAGLSLVDFSGGYVAAIAILGGLWRARRDGIGCDCDVSLHETAVSLLTYIATWAATGGYAEQRLPGSAHPSIVPFQNFETLDGWIVVACPKQAQWERLCRAAGRDELLLDRRFADLGSRSAHRRPLVEALAETFRARRSADWLTLLAAADVPSGPVNTLAEALRDEQLAAREAVDSYPHERFGTVRRIRSPLRLSGPRVEPARAPRRGEHTHAVLADLLGTSPAATRELAGRGAFGAVGPRPTR